MTKDRTKDLLRGGLFALFPYAFLIPIVFLYAVNCRVSLKQWRPGLEIVFQFSFYLLLFGLLSLFLYFPMRKRRKCATPFAFLCGAFLALTVITLLCLFVIAPQFDGTWYDNPAFLVRHVTSIFGACGALYALLFTLDLLICAILHRNFPSEYEKRLKECT